MRDCRGSLTTDIETDISITTGTFTHGAREKISNAGKQQIDPVDSVISIGLIWGMCVSNMIFVFLYCIGKMTKLNFKANQLSQANIFQRYPIIWWTNFLLVSLLLLSTWGWFVQCTEIGHKIIKSANCSPWCVFIIGTALIIILIVVGIVFFSKKTRFSETDD